MGESFLSDLLLSVTERGRALLGRNEEDARAGIDGLIAQCEAVLSGRGEATGMAIARDILNRYGALDAEQRLAFFQALANRFGPEPERLNRALANWKADPSDEQGAALHFASEPRRQELFRRLNRAPGGMSALVAMRADLLSLLDGQPALKSVDRDFHHLFSSWFNRGFLVLQRIEWSSPAIILDKIIRYEAVHEIHDWDDLRRRIDPPDRRCYAFFHPALENEPLIFVEIALTREIPAAIDPILAADPESPDAAKPTTAVFYSISNCQSGLQGVSFGNFLIKQVVDELSNDVPGIDTFATLSPVPDFVTWLRRLLVEDEGGLLDAARRTAVERLDRPGWHEDEKIATEMKSALLPLAAHYFLKAKTGRGEPVDPVARFHLGNGARLERLNWLGDRSDKGLAQSAGLMVNYRYELKDVERNHEAFANLGEIAAASAVAKHLKALSGAESRVKA